MPALETWRLKRRRADSMPSFSPTVTWVMKRFGTQQWIDRSKCPCRFPWANRTQSKPPLALAQR
jgi:hypothetical protein